MYGDVVMGVPHEKFEEAIAAAKEAAGVNLDVQLSADHLKALVGRYKAIYAEHIGAPFPDNAYEALRGAIQAVFKSWSSPRAVVYRKINKVSPTIIGTAVNVQVSQRG
jgi:pyruvate, orthophosphate dikinase